jgi:hypothetical protein
MASPGHSRVYSETLITETPRVVPYPARSVSAGGRYMGRGGRDGSPPLNSSSETLRDHHVAPLGPLSEDEVSPRIQAESASVRSSMASMDGYWSATSEHRSLSRSASNAQMRDLKDQMHDLKGRLSVLRDRARDDSMKRRSMQSLRTPSPFTAAEQWYTQAKEYKSPGLSDDAGVGVPSPKEEQKGFAFSNKVSAGANNKVSVPEDERSDAASSSHSRQENQKPLVLSEEEKYDTAEDGHGEESEDNDYNEEMVNREELDDYESDSSHYHDTLEHPISHEDREDAFDYEHFFLHSAMGTISQSKNGRRGSFSSEDSVETTRGPTSSDHVLQERPSLTHLRSESSDSISTVETFQTANEGHGSDSGNEDDFAVQQVGQAVRSTTPVSGKRSTFGSPASKQRAGESERQNSAIYNPEGRGGSNSHRPSVSSFNSVGSNGTQRSFPLINKPKSQISLGQFGNIASEQGSEAKNGGGKNPSPVDLLPKDDQILVERLLASFGKCVLGLSESSRGSYEGRVWRRRLDFARRTLDGDENVI